MQSLVAFLNGALVFTAAHSTPAQSTTRPATRPLVLLPDDPAEIRQRVHAMEASMYEQNPKLKEIEAKLAEIQRTSVEDWSQHGAALLQQLEAEKGLEAKHRYELLVYQWKRRTWAARIKEPEFAELLRFYQLGDPGRVKDTKKFLVDVDPKVAEVDMTTDDLFWQEYQKWMQSNVDRMTGWFDKSVDKYQVAPQLAEQAKRIGELEAAAEIYRYYVYKNTPAKLVLLRRKLEFAERKPRPETPEQKPPPTTQQ